jgi:uncharacterized UBP type Zn finger protein
VEYYAFHTAFIDDGHFVRGRQEDAHEFMNFLLGRIREAFGKGNSSVGKGSFIDECFGFTERSILTCPGCGINSLFNHF